MSKSRYKQLMVRKTQFAQSSFVEDKQKLILDVETPFPLKHLARASIIGARIARRSVAGVSTLGLPRILQDYVLLLNEKD